MDDPASKTRPASMDVTMLTLAVVGAVLMMLLGNWWAATWAIVAAMQVRIAMIRGRRVR